MTQIESNGHSISYGRMDQWLYPYYEKDIKEGKITKEFAQELLEVTFVKMNNPTKVRDGGTAKVRQGRGFGGECLTIGGACKDGNDLTNDLTMMMLGSSVHTRMMCPWLLVRMHKGTPYEVKVKAIEWYPVPDMAIRRSSTMRLRSRHLQERACRQRRQQIMQSLAALSLLSPVKSMAGMTAAYINTAKFMEMVLNGGRCLDCGEQCPRWEKCGKAGQAPWPGYRQPGRL